MSYVNFIKSDLNGDASDNTPEGSLVRTGGKSVIKTVTLNANNTTATVNLFQLTGTVEVISLHGEIMTSPGGNFSVTNVYFDLWDGTTSTPLTKITGASFSSLDVGSFFIKDSDSATELSVLNNNQARVKEAATGTRIRSNFLMTQKINTNTYVRLTYTTTATPLNMSVMVGMTYADIDNGTLTAV